MRFHLRSTTLDILPDRNTESHYNSFFLPKVTIPKAYFLATDHSCLARASCAWYPMKGNQMHSSTTTTYLAFDPLRVFCKWNHSTSILDKTKLMRRCTFGRSTGRRHLPRNQRESLLTLSADISSTITLALFHGCRYFPVLYREHASSFLSWINLPNRPKVR